MRAFAFDRYWARWITARRLASLRKSDPDYVERLERLTGIAGINVQLDAVG